MSNPSEHYILATGGKDVKRLRLLHEVYGPGTEALFRRVGLRDGQRVVEIGCGSGNIACWVARQVAPNGSVVAIDVAADQIEQARRQAQGLGLRNIEFQVADAYSPRLPEDSFDVVYCRYVLEHVRDPLRVLQEMRRVLKPGGKALAQENNIQMVAFDPDCPAFEAVWNQFAVLQDRLGGDALIGKRLFGLFHRAGFLQIELSYQPEIHPANKPTFRPWIENCITLLIGATEILQTHHLATQAEIHRAIAELQSLLERDDASALFHWNRACGVK